MKIDVTADVARFSRDMDRFTRQQLPFATALGLTRIAQRITAAETEGLDDTFDKPTPFTKKAFGVSPARKTSWSARVYARDIQASYLTPFLDGGLQVLGKKRGILRPGAVGLNAYGNLSKGKLAALKAKPNVFVGPVKLKDGSVINGVWQRGARGQRRAKGKISRGSGTKGSNTANRAKGVAARTTLKLLIKFDDPKPVTPRLPYEARARTIVERHFRSELEAALAQAMATAR